MRRRVTLIDYGIGNLLSVKRGFEHWDYDVEITNNPKKVLSAHRVVLPGVGSFKVGMQELSKLGMPDAIREIAFRGRPLLGICLGMQLLFDLGEENGITSGLGIIAGSVSLIQRATHDHVSVRIPHIGWNGIFKLDSKEVWGHDVLNGVEEGDEVYFNHSFRAETKVPESTIAFCGYGSQQIAAVVMNEKTIGCQFHPEKSGEIGLKILRNFVEK